MVSATPLGQGTLVSGQPVRGHAKHVQDVGSVVALLSDPELAQVIILTESASAATVMPLLPEVRGVVCTVGGPTSHIATVARDFGVTCVVGVAAIQVDQLDGLSIEIRGDGTVARNDL